MTWFRWFRGAVAACVVAFVVAGPAAAQEAAEEAEGGWPPEVPGIAWKSGPCKGALGTWSELAIPAGFHFTGQSGAKTWEAAMQNTSSPNELGVVIPGRGAGWYAYFEFDASGYVKDDEKSSLDADDLLDTLKSGQEQSNKERERRGWQPLQIVGWAEPPHFDDELKVLVWATTLESDGKQYINYDARLLGRSGVMRAGLVCGTEKFQSALPDFRKLCREHQFISGQKYSEYRSGDKIAEYGLAALVTGGALAVAAKTGLLQKFWKVIVLGIGALIAGAKKMFGKGDAEKRRPRRGVRSDSGESES